MTKKKSKKNHVIILRNCGYRSNFLVRKQKLTIKGKNLHCQNRKQKRKRLTISKTGNNKFPF